MLETIGQTMIDMWSKAVEAYHRDNRKSESVVAQQIQADNDLVSSVKDMIRNLIKGCMEVQNDSI